MRTIYADILKRHYTLILMEMNSQILAHTHTHTHTYMQIYYVYREREREREIWMHTM